MAITEAAPSRRNDEHQGTGKPGFVAQHGLWNEAQQEAAERVLSEIRAAEVVAVRVAFADTHGVLRGKTLSIGAFESALRNGLDSSLGPYLCDTGLDIVFFPFQEGGGVGIEEMTGAGDFVLVPDPTTFRILPWTDGVTGWVLADEYFQNGRPVPLSGRRLLQQQLQRLGERGLEAVVGIEVEWYLTRLVDQQLTVDGVGGFGQPGVPPLVAPVNLGYQFNIEHFTDELDPILHELRRHVIALDLPLRTTEHESGPGQLEFTFEPQPALRAADDMLLFRTAVKQICARNGYHATFMCRPALAGFDASGWHLHQSLIETETGANAFMSTDPDRLVSELARHYAGGLIEHAHAASVFTTPTINGYRRVGEEYVLAPSRAVWSNDNRGSYVRVLAEPGDPSSHLENRVGEPAANPYLYIASQIVAGLDGVDRELDPGEPTHDPHNHDNPPLPRSLAEAVAALKESDVFRAGFGSSFVDYIATLKENEIRRYEAATGDGSLGATPTEWEQREYFRVF